MDSYLVGDHQSYKEERQCLYLIIYDIIGNRRRNRLFKLLKSYGTPVQKSCFETYLTRRQCKVLREKISRIMDCEEDNIRIYQLNGLNKVYNLGRENNNAYVDVLVL